ncbi:fimbrial protein [Paraburkholderia sp. ZP32-5]|uniref:fimbrial protein n=1 Tax=Paraburkholderia sp. ZP32-5 TaxID=2883245 RepID=UPI001F1FF335|nr:fimbrial protein [Paraburkholderia sp. ZP32-5]
MNHIEKYLRIAGLILGVVAGMLAVPATTSAQSLPSVRLNFTGNYVATTCQLIGSPDMTETLPRVSTQSLAAPGAVAGEKDFTITMQCPSDVTGARVYFESGPATDPQTGNLTPQSISGVTSASNVQIRLANSDGTPIKVGDRSTMRVIPITSTDPTPARFFASYYATGRATAGRVSTFVTYVVEVP